VRGVRLALLLSLAACEDEVEPGSRELYELERLCFVPPADCTLLPSTDLSLEWAIVFDRFEFTRADLRHYWPGRRRRADALWWSTDAARDAPDRVDWPAFVDFHEAAELAQQRGMRLPTPREWLHVAVGRLGFQNPWGGAGREYFANTIVLQDGQDFSLQSPCNVGTFESGKSRPFGCYDLLGNVWEWVDGIVLGCDPPAFDRPSDELDDAHGTLSSIMGGAYDAGWRRTYEFDRAEKRQRFHARRVDKRTLSPSIGVRMCADAESYLWSMAPRWGEGSAARARVRAVGRHWAADALARSALKTLLARLRSQPGAAVALGWLEEGVLADR
jgi:hypothetical protein